MKYSKVIIESIGYELAPVVVTSEEIEDQLDSLYTSLKIPEGQLEALTGIYERRWWPEQYKLSDGAAAAAEKALYHSPVSVDDIEALVYTGVGRESFEPATACRVASLLGITGNAVIHDISNACLGMLSGMIDIANRIELGQIKAGVVVACETAREIVTETINGMLNNPTMENYIHSLATMTGGSGAAAIVLSDGSFGNTNAHTLKSATVMAAPEFHDLCKWGMEDTGNRVFKEYMRTDAVSVMKNGVELGTRTWNAFLDETGWSNQDVDKTICHQVGEANRNEILKMIDIPPEKDFTTFQFLGNMGTVSLPITAAVAVERQFLNQGDRVGFLGIGSGLNCMMMAVEW